MKQKLILFATLIMATSVLRAQSGTDIMFTSIAPSGQTLYYELVGWYSGDTIAAVSGPNGAGFGGIGAGMLSDILSEWDTVEIPVGELTIPDSVSYLGSTYPVKWIAWSFMGGGLTSIHLPHGIERISGFYWLNNSSLQNVYYYGTISQWCNMDIESGAGQFRSWNLYINDTLVEDLVIPANVYINSMGESPFGNCSSIRHATVFCTGELSYLFDGCINLEDVVISLDSIEQIIYSQNYINLFNTFQGCTKLKSVQLPELPDSISGYIGGSCFYGCDSLYSLQIPSRWHLSWNAFYGFGSLRTLILGDSVYIGENSLQGADNLDTIICLGEPFIPTPCTYDEQHLHWCNDNFGGRADSIHFIVPCGTSSKYDSICKRANYSDETISGFECYEYWSFPNIQEMVHIDYSYSFSSSNEAMGSVATTVVDCDSNIAVSATPTTGFQLAGWSDGGVGDVRTFHLTSDTNVTALFVMEDVVLHDTTYVHDTSFVNIHDTTFMDVHDTTYIDVPYAVHDTTIVMQYDTTYVDVPYAVHDTTIVTQYDTTYVDVPYAVHDTTIVTMYDTTYVDVPYAVHDTTIVTQYDTTYVEVPYAVHDTTIVTQHDTTYVDVPYAVHDTTVVTDTVTLTEYVQVHDTTYLTEYEYIYDTTYITLTDTMTITQYDTVDNYFYDTTFVTDTLYLFDTIYFYDTVYVHDTVYVPQEGIGDVEMTNIKLYQRDGCIVVEGAEGHTVTLYDVNGRVLATKRVDNMPLCFDVPASGTYLIKIGSYPARKVVVIR